MTASARIVFAVLVCATFAAFFVAQELKSTPPRVQDLSATPFFSPNRDGRHDRARMSFRLKHADDVTATVVDHDGDAIRTLVDNRRLRAGQRMRLVWDGTNASGREVPDDSYRIRLNLRRQGRAIVVPRNIDKDTTPPDVLVTSIGPVAAPGPELLPNDARDPARVSFRAAGRRKEILVYRTDVRPLRRVFAAPIKLDDDATQWSGTGPSTAAASLRAHISSSCERATARATSAAPCRCPRALSTGGDCRAAAGSACATCAPRRRRRP